MAADRLQALRPHSGEVGASDDGEDIFVPVPPDLALDDGSPLGECSIALRRFGYSQNPAVIIAGGISAGRDIAGEHGWWSALVASRGAVDLARFSVIGFDFVPRANRRVAVSPSAQARLLCAALDHLRIERIHAFIGASYGGMVGLAFAEHAPKRLRRLCVIAAAHRPARLAQAWRGVQRRVVEFAASQGQAAKGLALARQLAMITYRSSEEFEARFDGALGPDGRSDLDSYLIARGQAYASVVDAERWLSLSEAIDRTNVAPERIEAATTLIACPSDQLAPCEDMAELARRLPNLKALHTLASIYGHDAFLKEHARLGPMLRVFLEADNEHP